MTPAQVALAVASVAPSLRAEDVAPAWRWWRWVAEAGGDLVAFVAEDDAAWVRLRREAALLARLAAAMACAVPTVVAVDEAARVQVRRKVPGLTGRDVERVVFGRADDVPAAARYADALAITAQGRRLAGDVGRALAELHGAVAVSEADALGFERVSYAATLDAIDAALAARAGVGDVRAALPTLRRWLAALPAASALCHRDAGPHNLAVDPATGALTGLFDLDDAAVAHRAEDFKYLPSLGGEFTALALDAYAVAGAPRLAGEDVGRFHALAAVEHALFVPEDAPRWPSIVAWSRAAIGRFVVGR